MGRADALAVLHRPPRSRARPRGRGRPASRVRRARLAARRHPRPAGPGHLPPLQAGLVRGGRTGAPRAARLVPGAHRLAAQPTRAERAQPGGPSGRLRRDRPVDRRAAGPAADRRQSRPAGPTAGDRRRPGTRAGREQGRRLGRRRDLLDAARIIRHGARLTRALCGPDKPPPLHYRNGRPTPRPGWAPVFEHVRGGSGQIPERAGGSMSSGITAVIIVVAIIVIVAVVAMTMAARRRRLQQNFGPEYDRAVAEKDSRKQAEAELTERQRRVRKYDIRPLSLEARSRYLGEWQAIQEQFVDSPQAAVTEAYALVTTVMQERGYPPVEDDQVADDLSVDHADTVGHFRSAQAITREAAHGSVATEDLRQAFIHYRELFADLLGDTEDADGQPVARATPTAATARGATTVG